jgi:flagellar motor switch/type III secretory pathway protein FliN
MAGAELATIVAQDMKMTEMEVARVVSKIPWMMRIEEHPSWEMLAQLRASVRAGVSLRGFTVGDLLAMREGQVFESVSSATEDVPVTIGEVQVGWSEFEVLEHTMALRLTRLR